ncbi:transcriptional regulator PpsR [Aurantimonas aggregata]|uniref:Transcriptional regulator PpsR n=1 Tax=Aurantimonas aggregata TaxID=2047720 RepID=A0A6L9MBQ8_9HYPH|nr:transcriptional regulator PpsR [Aurantimonas aggregata]NDV85275.1 transcriptional regulator PpsR [Aurantimonas aggregata]
MGINYNNSGSAFSDPGRSFANLEATLVANMVTASTDIALLIDSKGIIADVAVRDAELFGDVPASWIGQPFIDVVTVECRSKVGRMLSDRNPGEAAPRREINHPMPGGPDLPISYAMLSLARDGARLALGRDLRTISILQQKLVETQLAMESDYARLQNAESQYRVFFDTSSDPIVIADAASGKILEANSAARRMLESDGRQVAGVTIESLFAERSVRDLDKLVAAARASGDIEIADLALRDDDSATGISARFYRQHGATRLSLRFGRNGNDSLSPGAHDLIAKAGRELPDAIVVVDNDLKIVAANESFLDLAEIATGRQATGKSLGDIIGRRGVEMAVVKTAVDAEGVVRSFSTTLHTQHGGLVDVELSGSILKESDQQFYGFSLRRAARAPQLASATQPLRSANDMTGLVGRVPLREIVRETADIIEQLCIEAALDLTRNNRASAAEMLGLSRQSLYSKLRRYGIGDPSPDSGDNSVN